MATAIRTRQNSDAGQESLFREYRRTRDERLCQEIVREYLPLVRRIVHRYRTDGVDEDDLVQLGCLGLVKAIRTFDPGRGVKFATYACHHVRGQIVHHIRDRGGIIRPPRWMYDLRGRLSSVIAALQQRLGRMPSPREIASQMGMPEGRAAEALRVFSVMHAASLDDDEEERRKGRPAELPWDAVDDRLVLDDIIARLPPLERRVVRAVFYLDMTQTDTARLLGISQRHVSRVRASALRRMARLMREPV